MNFCPTNSKYFPNLLKLYFILVSFRNKISLKSLDYDKIYNVIDIKDELLSNDYSVSICSVIIHLEKSFLIVL